MELLRDSVEKHQKDLDDLERDAVLRVQKAKEEEWASNNALQNEKLVLVEAKVKIYILINRKLLGKMEYVFQRPNYLFKDNISFLFV